MKVKSKLRAAKAAKLKLAILDATIELIGEGSFKDLHINDLCSRVNISKVTLFKYFPQKEDILLYYMRIWTFHRAVEVHRNEKKGVEGIYYLIIQLSNSFDRNPGLVLSYLGYLANTHTIEKPFPIRIDERQLLYPDIEDVNIIDIQPMDQLLETFLLEAIFNKEITKSSNPKDLAYLMVSIIYGSLLTAHALRIEPSKLYFRRNIEMMLNGLK
jgi:AcrR family transcriptional regulator